VSDLIKGEQGRIFYIYENRDFPTIYAYENKQPDYTVTNHKEYKCISVESDLDSYIYFLQHTHDEKIKQLEQENAKLKEVVNNAMSILSELNNDFDSMEHSYVGKDSDYHKRIKAVLKWGSDEN
jgi:hypothetical protein